MWRWRIPYRLVRRLLRELAAEGAIDIAWAVVKIFAVAALPTVIGLYLTWWTWVEDAPIWIQGALTVVVVLLSLCGSAVVVIWLPRWFARRVWRQPLNVDAEISAYTVGPTAPGQAEQIHRLTDVLIVSRESKRLDARIKLTFKMGDGSEWSRPALIDCRGLPRAYTEQQQRTHLPTEIPLPTDGPPVRGHVEFITPNPIDPDEVFVDIEDLRSRRKKRIRVSGRLPEEVERALASLRAATDLAATRDGTALQVRVDCWAASAVRVEADHFNPLWRGGWLVSSGTMRLSNLSGHRVNLTPLLILAGGPAIEPLRDRPETQASRMLSPHLDRAPYLGAVITLEPGETKEGEVGFFVPPYLWDNRDNNQAHEDRIRLTDQLSNRNIEFSWGEGHHPDTILLPTPDTSGAQS